MLLRDPGSPIFHTFCSHDPESIHALNDETEHKVVEKSTPKDINHFQHFRLKQTLYQLSYSRVGAEDSAWGAWEATLGRPA